MKRTTSNIIFHWLPYLFIALGLGAGLYVSEHTDTKWHNERDDRIVHDCRSIKKNTVLLRRVIEESFDEPIVIPVPERADDVVREVIEGVNERSAANAAVQKSALLALVPEIKSCEVKGP